MQTINIPRLTMADEKNILPVYYRCGFNREQLEGLVLRMRGVSSHGGYLT